MVSIAISATFISMHVAGLLSLCAVVLANGPHHAAASAPKRSGVDWSVQYIAAHFDGDEKSYLSGIVERAYASIPSYSHSVELFKGLEAFDLIRPERRPLLRAYFESFMIAMTLIDPQRGRGCIRRELAVYVLYDATRSGVQLAWIRDFCIVKNPPYPGVDCEYVTGALKILKAWKSIRHRPAMNTFMAKMETFSSRVSTNLELIHALTAVCESVTEFLVGNQNETAVFIAVDDALAVVKQAETDFASADISL